MSALPAGVTGEVATPFEAVADAALAAFALQGRQGGLQVAARHRGDWVVDLAVGAVSPGSLVHTWSAVKPVVGSCLLLLVDRGAVELDTPVRELWPELRAADDGSLVVRHVLTHGAGLARVPSPRTLEGLLDWDATVAALGAAAPDWPAGSAVGEHALTYGHLVGELIRRVDGRPIGRFLADELAGPLDVDVHLGLRSAGDLERCVDLGFPIGWWDDRLARDGGAGVIPAGDPAIVNSGAWRRAEVPAVNGQATARGLAGFWAALLDGSLPAGVDAAGASGLDQVLGETVTWTLAGGQVEERRGSTEVGMGGLGGQYGCARPGDDLAYAFLTTEMADFDRVDLVEDALLACCATA